MKELGRRSMKLLARKKISLGNENSVTNTFIFVTGYFQYTKRKKVYTFLETVHLEPFCP